MKVKLLSKKKWLNGQRQKGSNRFTKGHRSFHAGEKFPRAFLKDFEAIHISMQFAYRNVDSDYCT